MKSSFSKWNYPNNKINEEINKVKFDVFTILCLKFLVDYQGNLYFLYMKV